VKGSGEPKYTPEALPHCMGAKTGTDMLTVVGNNELLWNMIGVKRSSKPQSIQGAVEMRV